MRPQCCHSTFPGGLANLLNNQKGNIAAALPPGFSNLLGGTGLLDALGDKVKAGAAPAQRAVGDSASLLGKWLIPAALAALALLLVSNYGCNRKTAEKVETPAPPPAATVPAQNPPMAAAVNYADIASKALSDLTTVLAVSLRTKRLQMPPCLGFRTSPSKSIA